MGKIIEGHTFEEYHKKYGKKFDDGKLQFVKFADKNKLNSKENYWEIEDGNKPGYYEISNKPWLIPIIILGSVATITAAVVPTVLLIRCQPTPPEPVVEYCDFKFIGTNCQIKVDGEYKKEHTFSLEKGKQSTETYSIKANNNFTLPTNPEVPSIITYTKTDDTNATLSFNNVINNDVDVDCIVATPSKIQKWYLFNNWWDFCSCGFENVEADEEDIGQTVQLKVNNQNHDVRLIGLDHDDEVDGDGKIIGKAHTTFQFANLLCDENGYSLGVIEDFEHNEGCMSRNYDFLNSGLRKNLTGKGDSEIMWFQRGDIIRSQEYGSMTVMDMLPQELKSVLKEVKKEIYTDADHQWDFQPTYYDDKLFVPTYREMFKEGSDWDSYFYEEGTTYNYYLEDDYGRSFTETLWTGDVAPYVEEYKSFSKMAENLRCTNLDPCMLMLKKD